MERHLLDHNFGKDQKLGDLLAAEYTHLGKQQ